MALVTAPMAVASDDGWDDGSFGFYQQRNPYPYPQQQLYTRRRGGQYYYYQPMPQQQGWW